MLGMFRVRVITSLKVTTIHTVRNTDQDSKKDFAKMPRIATSFKRFGISTIKLTMPSFIVLLFHTSVQLTHSLGGGTGSGVGTYVLSMLCDQFPKISRFSACVFPSELNDVVTSPYNTVLAMQQLCEHADCVFPLDNTALFQFARPPCQSGLFK